MIMVGKTSGSHAKREEIVSLFSLVPKLEFRNQREMQEMSLAEDTGNTREIEQDI